MTIPDLSTLHLSCTPPKKFHPAADPESSPQSRPSSPPPRTRTKPTSSPSSSPPPPPPPHRSHDRSNNLKRSDPFQFGSRYLLPEDDVFEFNAWDHVATTSEYDAYAETQYASQRCHPVSDYDRTRFNADPERWWNRFYTNNTANFFKDRKWLGQEFPVLKDVTERGAGRKVVLEVGAGAGNTAFPIMRGNENEELVLHAVDFSKKSVEVIRSSPLYAEQRCGRIEASVWDIASDTALPEGLEERSVDVVMMIFIFSALSPQQWDAAVRNVFRLLKPGGEVCFRDYGRGDLAQVRFRKGRWMQENFYARGDGTRVYFFGVDELRRIWSGRGGNATKQADSRAEMKIEGTEKTAEEEKKANNIIGDDDDLRRENGALEILSLGVDRRLIVNRQRKLKMYRCWMQGRFQRSGDEQQSTNSTNGNG
ncbi:MAG: hypothetical protein Q9191_002354 [Dirinaria sp. TL-2023a]